MKSKERQQCQFQVGNKFKHRSLKLACQTGIFQEAVSSETRCGNCETNS